LLDRHTISTIASRRYVSKVKFWIQ